MRLQSKSLLHWAVNEIRTQGVGLKERTEHQTIKIEELKSELAQLQEDSSNTKSLTCQKLFGLSDWSLEYPQRMLDKYKQDRNGARRDSHLFEGVEAERLAEYRQQGFFEEWETSNESSMLFVIGVCHERLRRREHCWISSLALDLVNRAPTSSMEPAY